MNRVTIDLEALRQNIAVIDGWMSSRAATWTLVTKVMCGHEATLRGLQLLGVRSLGDSRLDNLRAVRKVVPCAETWYLRLPHLSAVQAIVELADVSLNSEREIIQALNAEARRQNKMHRIIVMIELGDLREGILPGSLVAYYRDIVQLSNVTMVGIGANLGCLAGAVPSVDQLTQLSLYRELLELKFERELAMISAGSSAVLPLLLRGGVPQVCNHFRIGEAAFLGTDLVYGGTLPGLRADAVTLDAEVVEIKEKSLVPLGETTVRTPFEPLIAEETTPGQRGYRALVTVGQLDTEVSGLTPIDPRYRIAGASSDLTVVNIGDDPGGLNIGDTIRFRVNYAALLRLMSGQYIGKALVPSIEEFAAQLTTEQRINVPPVVNTATPDADC